MAFNHTDKYTLGRGEVYFAPFKTGTETPGAERYLGNTPEFNLTIEEEKLEHYSSDRGIKEKDRSISLQVNRSGSLVCDNIDIDNVAAFFFGSKSTITQSSLSVTDEVLTSVELGRYYPLGQSTSNPTGYQNLDIHTAPSTKIILTDSAGTTTYVEGTDYEIDLVTGRLYLKAGGSIVAGTNLKVDYKVKASTRSRVISGSQPIKGALRFLSQNPEGTLIDYYMPYVTLAPNGDFALKSDEWQQIPFTIEVLKKSGMEAIYADERSVAS